MLKFNVDFLKSQASGSTFAELSRTTLKEITFSIPPLPEQRAIAEVLSALDDKIELNRRMNQTLEQLARAIYKHMFIDNPEREGWEVKSLSELAEFVKGVSYSSSDLVEDSNIALVTLKSFNRGGGYKEEGLKPFVGFFKPQQRIFPGEVVVAHTDLTQMAEVIGRSARVEENEVHTTLVASLDLVIVRPKQLGITNEYIYCLLAYGDFSDFAYGYTNGTTVLHLSKKALEEYKVFAPPSTFLITFSEKVTPLFKQIDLNNKQSRTLAKLRDTLLPKLMSGQVIINEVNT
jgi:type I restriction enzyme S subunit